MDEKYYLNYYKMPRTTLLLNNTYEILDFIGIRKAIKLMCNDKVDILSDWEDIITFPSGSISYPAILKMKYKISRPRLTLSFSKKAVLRRDNLVCQYCGFKLNHNNATIDHIIPKSMNGQTSWKNCVAACHICNGRKANKTPEMAHMILINDPLEPIGYYYPTIDADNWHPDWYNYIQLK